MVGWVRIVNTCTCMVSCCGGPLIYIYIYNIARGKKSSTYNEANSVFFIYILYIYIKLTIDKSVNEMHLFVCMQTKRRPENNWCHGEPGQDRNTTNDPIRKVITRKSFFLFCVSWSPRFLGNDKPWRKQVIIACRKMHLLSWAVYPLTFIRRQACDIMGEDAISGAHSLGVGEPWA